MGTKNNPGKFDCYANALPDEPMFILLGRDPSASTLVSFWALARQRAGEDPAKVEEAFTCAEAMRKWAIDMGKADRVAAAARQFTVPGAMQEYDAIAGTCNAYLDVQKRVLESDAKPDDLLDELESTKLAFLASIRAFIRAIEIDIRDMQDADAARRGLVRKT